MDLQAQPAATLRLLVHPLGPADLGGEAVHVSIFRNDLVSGLAGSVPGTHVDAREQGVALQRIRVSCQHVLQGGCQLVGVEGHHAVVMVACSKPKPHTVSISSGFHDLVFWIVRQFWIVFPMVRADV
jgi:hypothetical protein